MARIPGIEGLGEQVARPVSFNQTQTPAGAFGGQVANVLGGIGADMAREERRQEAQAEQVRLQEEREAKQAQQAADKAQALTALQSAQDDLLTITDEVAEGVRTGTIDKARATEEFQTRARDRVTAATESLPEAFRALGQVELTGKVGRFGREVSKAVTQRNQGEVRAGIDQTLEYAGRLYLKDPAAADKMVADSLDQLGPQSGLGQLELQRLRQGFKETSQFTLATTLVQGAEQNPQALRSVLKALDNPEYLPDIDPQRRLQVRNSALNSLDVLQRRAEADAERREARADRAVATAERQLASGVPLTTKAWEDLRRTTSGTAAQATLTALIQGEREIQELLRKPVNEQLALVQQRQAALMSGGGTMAEAANLQRLNAAVERNVRTLQQDPLQFAAQREGVEVVPLQLAKLLQPGGAAELRSVVVDRTTTVDTLRKQYGDAVPTNVLRPTEAKEVAALLNQSSVTGQTLIFQGLRTLAGGDSRVYQAMMRQVAPDSPVKALAGIIADKQANVTTERNWITSNAVRGAGEVATTLLRGESILNPGAADKSQDGKPKATLFLPDAAAFTSALVEHVGEAFIERPQALQAAQQAAMAYYVGRAAEMGRLHRDSKDIDSRMVKEALAATLGETVERNGTRVFAPWGMGADEFEGKAQRAFAAELQRRGMSPALTNRWPMMGLRQLKGDMFMVTQGRTPVLDNNGQPLTVTVSGPGDPIRDGQGVPIRETQIPTSNARKQ